MTGNTGGFSVGFVGWCIALLAFLAAIAGGPEVLTMLVIVGIVVFFFGGLFM